jgi:hypothetical protein
VSMECMEFVNHVVSCSSAALQTPHVALTSSSILYFCCSWLSSAKIKQEEYNELHASRAFKLSCRGSTNFRRYCQWKRSSPSSGCRQTCCRRSSNPSDSTCCASRESRGRRRPGFPSRHPRRCSRLLSSSSRRYRHRCFPNGTNAPWSSDRPASEPLG